MGGKFKFYQQKVKMLAGFGIPLSLPDGQATHNILIKGTPMALGLLRSLTRKYPNQI